MFFLKRPLRLAFHPFLLAVIGLASGALALGAASLGFRAEGRTVPPLGRPIMTRPNLALASYMPGKRYPWFPALYEPKAMSKPEEGPFLLDLSAIGIGIAASEDRASLIPALANNEILAFYGKPDSRSMGILGEYPIEELAKLLEGYAKLYDEQNGEQGVVPAFYLIYGTCWPGGEIGYLKDSVVLQYIEFARSKGWLVFLDHQIGKYGVADSVKRLLPWLKYPNVHIAIDPEWRTESPMKEIGGVDAAEINAAEAMMSDYLVAEGIPGAKMLIVHQFQDKMIGEREKVRADFDGVFLIHTADGFGPPALKRSSYSSNARAGNIPLKGFKLFLKSDVEGAGYDDPLLRPADVLALEPRPRLIIYQ